MQHLKRQGRRVGGLPYGWRSVQRMVSGELKSFLEPDPAQQVVVELARVLRRAALKAGGVIPACAGAAPAWRLART